MNCTSEDTPLPAAGSALVLVDMQKSFCCGAHGNNDIEAAVDRILALKSRFNELDRPVVLVFSDPAWHGIEQSGGGLYRVPLAPRDIPVGRHWSNSAFRGGKIEQALQANHVKTLFIAGVNLSFCVKATALDAATSGEYAVFIVEDCCANGDEIDDHCVDADLRELKSAGVQFVSSDAVLGALAAAAPPAENWSVAAPSPV